MTGDSYEGSVSLDSKGKPALNVVLNGSLVNIPTTPGIASDSFTTHNAIPVAAGSSATAVEVVATGYRRAILLVKGDGTHNCQGFIYGEMRDGSSIVQIASTAAGLTGFASVDLNGLDKIQINVQNTDGANANTITADVFLQQ